MNLDRLTRQIEWAHGEFDALPFWKRRSELRISWVMKLVREMPQVEIELYYASRD